MISRNAIVAVSVIIIAVVFSYLYFQPGSSEIAPKEIRLGGVSMMNGYLFALNDKPYIAITHNEGKGTGVYVSEISGANVIFKDENRMFSVRGKYPTITVYQRGDSIYFLLSGPNSSAVVECGENLKVRAKHILQFTAESMAILHEKFYFLGYANSTYQVIETEDFKNFKTVHSFKDAKTIMSDYFMTLKGNLYLATSVEYGSSNRISLFKINDAGMDEIFNTSAMAWIYSYAEGNEICLYILGDKTIQYVISMDGAVLHRITGIDAMPIYHSQNRTFGLISKNDKTYLAVSNDGKNFRGFYSMEKGNLPFDALSPQGTVMLLKNHLYILTTESSILDFDLSSL